MSTIMGIVNRLFTLAGIIGVLGLYWSDVRAEPPNVTMSVVESEDVDEASFVSEIRLPDSATLRAQQQQTQRGRDRDREPADQARERGREFGQQRASEAREKGREAREAAGNAPGQGIRDRPDTTPQRPDGPPGRPDSPPGRPDTPPGRPDTPPGRPDSPPGRPDTPPGQDRQNN